MPDSPHLRDRVRAVGPSLVQARSGVPFSTLSSWLNRPGARLREDTLRRIVEAVDALSDDSRSRAVGVVSAQVGGGIALSLDAVEVGGEMYLPVRILADAAVSAGDGTLITNEDVVSHQLFSEQWLRRITRASLDDLVLLYVSGDSMADTLQNGDMILVDRTMRRLREEGIYVVTLGDMLLVKRVQLAGDGAVLLLSDNPRYQPIRVDEPERLQVLARIIWAGRTMV